MKKIISVIFIAAFLFACNNEKAEETAAPADGAATAEKAPMELLAPPAGDDVKTANVAFEKGDIEGFTAGMDDNVLFRWSGGDSLVGKQAVKDYYNGRWKVLESIKFSNDIMIPLMANVSPNGGVTSSGKWVLSWHQANAKYKNGKSITFWFHTTRHYNDAGMVDQVTQFIDRAPIAEASK